MMEETFRMNDLFRRFAQRTSQIVGSPWAFITALFLLILWGISGSLFKFSDTWQLVINTATTIVTFLIVFLIQNTQNRDAKAIHLKLDELIRAVKGARNALVDLEDMSDEQLEELKEQFIKLSKRYELISEKQKSKTAQSVPADNSQKKG